MGTKRGLRSRSKIHRFKSRSSLGCADVFRPCPHTPSTFLYPHTVGPLAPLRWPLGRGSLTSVVIGGGCVRGVGCDGGWGELLSGRRAPVAPMLLVVAPFQVGLRLRWLFRWLLGRAMRRLLWPHLPWC
jgi:hypothetical protein